MSEQRWYRPAHHKPANNQKIYWMDSAGNVYDGVYVHGRWYYEDTSTPISKYFEPQFWKPREEGIAALLEGQK